MRRFEAFQGVYEVLRPFLRTMNLLLSPMHSGLLLSLKWPCWDLTPFFKFRILIIAVWVQETDGRLFDIAMKKLMINPEESVYIGDNPQKDLLGAKKAGMGFILFRSEFKPDSDFQTRSAI